MKFNQPQDDYDFGVDIPTRDIYYHTSDGLKIYARIYPQQQATTPPILCLPGLTRNMRDFLPLISYLHPHASIILTDFRGRGRSDYAVDPASYRPDVELKDTLSLLDMLGIPHVAVIGTSRGGIVGLLMAALAPERMCGLFLNDLGPVLERDGLLRIRRYLGSGETFSSWPDVVSYLRQHNPTLCMFDEAQWLRFAHQLYRSTDSGIIADYDPALALHFPSEAQLMKDKPPDLWPYFLNFPAIPWALVRGEDSDLLSFETLAMLAKMRPDIAISTIAQRGHAPFLDEAQSIRALNAWLSQLKGYALGADKL